MPLPKFPWSFEARNRRGVAVYTANAADRAWDYAHDEDAARRHQDDLTVWKVRTVKQEVQITDPPPTYTGPVKNIGRGQDALAPVHATAAQETTDVQI